MGWNRLRALLYSKFTELTPMICPHGIVRRCVLLPFLIFYWAAPLVVAQGSADQASAEPKPESGAMVLKRTVRRVLVDVVVQDSNGKSVRGLTARDFAVFEDGRRQNIVSLDAHDLDRPSLSMPPNAPAQPPNVFVNLPNRPERGPLYVILYDMVNMEVEDQLTARLQTLKFISSKPEGTRFAIFVHSDGLHLVQGFTDDKDLLVAALDQENPAPHLPRSFLMSRNFGRGDPIAMMSVFTHIAEFLDGLPGRKNLIWMAGMFPLALYPHEGDPQDLRDQVRREVHELTRAQVAVYPVNIRGVVANPEGALTGLTPFGGNSAVAPMPGPSGSSMAVGNTPSGSTTSSSASGLQTASGLQHSGVSDSLSSGYMMQNDVATATGGHALYSNNDLKSALAEATDLGAHYYSLSYAPTNPNYDGSLRKIQVAIAKAGYRLEYRPSYYADDPDTPIRHETKKNASEEDTPEQAAVKLKDRPLYASLQHGAPLIHDLVFKVRVHAVGTPALASAEQMAVLAHQPAYTRGKPKNPFSKPPKPIQVQRYAIYYLIAASQIELATDGSIPLEFAAVAFDSDGWAVNGAFEQAAEKGSFNPGSGALPIIPGSRETRQGNAYRAMQELDLPVTATSLRVAVRDNSTDRIGAIEIPLPLASEPETSKTVPSARTLEASPSRPAKAE
jgi:VWFA-related protein